MTIWYVARLAPGATRPAKNHAYRAAKPEETVFEQDMAENGFTAYLPKMRRDAVHHRTKKKSVKAFALLTGYAFVSVPSDSRWAALRACDSVSGVLGANGRPWAVPADQISRFREAEANMEFDTTHAAEAHRAREARRHRGETAERLPTGAQVSVTSGQFAGHHGSVVSVTGRGQVKIMLEMFGGLVPVEMPASDLWQDAA